MEIFSLLNFLDFDACGGSTLEGRGSKVKGRKHLSLVAIVRVIEVVIGMVIPTMHHFIISSKFTNEN